MEHRQLTLLETLDRVLNKGVVIVGDVTLSVADVDLIFLGLKAILASVETAKQLDVRYEEGSGRVPDRSETSGGRDAQVPPDKFLATSQLCPSLDGRTNPHPYTLNSPPCSNPSIAPRTGPRRLNFDPDTVEQGLAKLALTLIELIRKLLEKQALRRVEAGSLTSEEIERMGLAFLKLEEKMGELLAHFDLKDEDLNLHLGPLGDLL